MRATGSSFCQCVLLEQVSNSINVLIAVHTFDCITNQSETWTLPSGSQRNLSFTLFAFLTGDPELSGVLDANGSNESFELVTEENNKDGSKKPGTEGRCSLIESQNLQIVFVKNMQNRVKHVLWVLIINQVMQLSPVCSLSQGRPVRMNGFLWSFALGCLFLALS